MRYIAILMIVLCGAIGIHRARVHHSTPPRGTPFTEFTITTTTHWYKCGSYIIDKQGVHFDAWSARYVGYRYSNDDSACHVDIPSTVGVIVESRTVNP